MQHRKKYAGRLIKTIREISDLPLKGVEEFGDREHTVSSEPYYYDTAYHPVKRHSSIPVDENGKCIVAEVIASAKVSTKTQPKPASTEASEGCSHGDELVCSRKIQKAIIHF